MKKLIHKYKKYSAYKDSGIEWLGDVPKDWEVKRLKYVLQLINDKTLSLNSNKLYIGMENIESYTGRYIRTENEVEGLANKFKINNILFGKLRPYLTKVYLAHFNGLCSTEFLVYKTNYPKFFHKLMLSNSFINIVDSSTYGAKMPRASSEFIGNIPLAFPPIAEQTAIANFLDDKTGKIEKAISQKEKMIALLKERKQIIIQNAVTGKWTITKGKHEITPPEKLKDSGVEWIGKIPKHWEVKRLKYVSTILMGQSPDNQYVNDKKHGIPFLQGNAEFNILYPNAKLWCSKPKKISNIGDLLFSIRAPVGAINISNKVYCIGRGLCAINAINIKKEYLYYCAINFKIDLNKYITGSTFEAVSTFNMRNIFTPLPPLSEQKSIVNFIESQFTKIDKAINLQERQIEKLKEYKAILIDNAVTGKIKVN